MNILLIIFIIVFQKYSVLKKSSHNTSNKFRQTEKVLIFFFKHFTCVWNMFIYIYIYMISVFRHYQVHFNALEKKIVRLTFHLSYRDLCHWHPYCSVLWFCTNSSYMCLKEEGRSRGTLDHWIAVAAVAGGGSGNCNCKRTES